MGFLRNFFKPSQYPFILLTAPSTILVVASHAFDAHSFILSQFLYSAIPATTAPANASVRGPPNAPVTIFNPARNLEPISITFDTTPANFPIPNITGPAAAANPINFIILDLVPSSNPLNLSVSSDTFVATISIYGANTAPTSINVFLTCVIALLILNQPSSIIFAFSAVFPVAPSISFNIAL